MPGTGADEADADDAGAVDGVADSDVPVDGVDLADDAVPFWPQSLMGDGRGVRSGCAGTFKPVETATEFDATAGAVDSGNLTVATRAGLSLDGRGGAMLGA
jgi:hypothetical protein